MSILNATIITSVLLVISAHYNAMQRKAMTEAMKMSLPGLRRSWLTLVVAALLAVVGYVGDVRISYIALLVALTGIGSYFRYFQEYGKKHLQNERAQMLGLWVWLSWLAIMVAIVLNLLNWFNVI